MQFIQGGKQTHEVTILQHSLTSEVPRLAHDELGHNRSTRAYLVIKKLYNGKGLINNVHVHNKRL